MSFDEWYVNTNNGTARDAYKAGAQSRQAEVDALNAMGEMSEQKIEELVLVNIELQKRIDKALMQLDEFHKKSLLSEPAVILDCIKILKGEENE